MRALIFGAHGQLGQALVSVAPREVQLFPLGRSECDIADADAVGRAIANVRPDVVFNAAAYTAVDRAEAEPGVAEKINADAAGAIAVATRESGARLIHVSTDFVFDGTKGRPYVPSDAVAPLSVYGRTKLEGERMVAAADPTALIVRTAWVYAARGGNFMNTMLRLMRERGTVSVVADQFGTPTFATSLASALWALSASGASGIHHFTDAGVATWYDFAVAIAEEALAVGLIDNSVMIRPITTQQYPTPAQRPVFAVLDKSVTWEVLGEPAAHWRFNLRIALKELRNYG